MPLTPAPTVRESVESAVDTVVTAEPSVPAQETLPAEPATTPPTEAKAEAPAQETEAQKAERLRNKDGAFAKGKPEQKAESAAAPAEPAKQAAPKAPRPSSWKKELESHWDTLSPEIQAYVNEREKQYATGVSAYKTEADRAKGVMSAIAPFEPMLQRSNIPVDRWIQSLGHAHHLLTNGSPQDRVQTVAQIIRNNGVDAQALFQVLTGQQPTYQPQTPQQPQQPALSPADIEAKVEEALIKKEASSKYDAFTKAVADGQHPHFEEVKGTMHGLLQAGLADDYASAYEAALRHPRHANIFEAIQKQEAEKKEAERVAAEKAKVTHARSQAVSVKSSTPSAMTQASGPKGLREQLSESFDKATAGRV